MSDVENRFWVRVEDDELDENSRSFRVSFVPKGMMNGRGANGVSSRVPSYGVIVVKTGDDLSFLWGQSPDDPGDLKGLLHAEIKLRMLSRKAWIERVKHLICDVQEWATELGWSPRQIDKKLDDAYIGRHLVPALLMQRETSRILLEPVGRSGPGSEGLVDLYLLPAYDDIARLVFREGRWFINSFEPDEQVPEPQDVLLSKESFDKVLIEMRIHAN